MSKRGFDLLGDAKEYFYYSRKYRGQVLVFVLDEAAIFEDILPELELMKLAGMHPLLLFNDSSGHLSIFSSLANCSYPFYLKTIEGGKLSGEILADLEVSAFSNSSEDKICAAVYSQIVGFSTLLSAGLECVDYFHSPRLFLLSKEVPEVLEVNSKSYSCLSYSLFAEGLKDASSRINLRKPIQELFAAVILKIRVPLVLLNPASGSVFEEVFTHRGSGILVSDNSSGDVRQAQSSDVVDIMVLLRPYIATGTILPIGFNEIMQNIESFWLFVIETEIIGGAMLKDFGEFAELGKLCMLPRYQRARRAALLVQKLVEVAREKSKKAVFALSCDPKTCTFFLKQGFKEVTKETLPKSWQDNYDMKRDSKAFLYDLNSAIA